MKHVMLIPDSFKGTMSSQEICTIMEKVIKTHHPDAQVTSIPVADGGEGSVDAFLLALGGERHTLTVKGPWQEEVEGFYGILPNGTAVIEMAASAGLPLVGERLDPSQTTTWGVGQLILDAARKGATSIVVGLGGSATNDGGCGAAAACGIRFYNAKGESFVPLGATLADVASIDCSALAPELVGLPVTSMCDIDNPYWGPSGAAHIFGPQKGADQAMIEELDNGLKHLAEVMQRDCAIDVQQIPGSGAAGGMGGGMAAFFSSELKLGIDVILDTVGFDAMLDTCDLIFTGEGKIDGQSVRGKVVVGVGRRAKKKGVPTIAVVGDIGDDVEGVYDEGVSGIFSINRLAIPYKEARVRAQADLERTMDNLVRFIDSLCR
jgi:glycerate kinase